MLKYVAETENLLNAKQNLFKDDKNDFSVLEAVLRFVERVINSNQSLQNSDQNVL